MKNFQMLRERYFIPIFIIQFFEAFNDNLLRNGLAVLVTYQLAMSQQATNITVQLAIALFMLPFFLFSALAGQLADKYCKAYLIRWIKIIEILAMIVAGVGFITQSVVLLLIALFVMGVHSTFFGPIKYAILPEQVPKNQLITANAIIEASTFLSILLGLSIAGLLMPLNIGAYIMAAIGVLFAVVGLITSFYVIKSRPKASNLTLNFNILQETVNIIKYARRDERVFYPILGISWLWLLGAMYISQAPTYVKYVLYGDYHIEVLFIGILALGVACGAYISEKLQKGIINANYVPVGILGMSIFLFEMYFACGHITAPADGQLETIWEFLKYFEHWRIMLDTFFIWVFAGIFVVPLYAMMQYYAKEDERSRIIAANNVLNSLFMLVSAIIVSVLYYLHFSIMEVFLMAACLNLLTTYFAFWILPESLIKSVMNWVFRLVYRVEVKGLEHYKAAGDRLVIIANHVSFLDGVLISAFLPKKTIFAINTIIARSWWIRPLLRIVDAFPLNSTNPMAIKSLIKLIKEDRHCIIFPEGRITVTGALMKVYEGPGMIAAKSQAKILPVHIEGGLYTLFSRLRGKIRLRWFPKITLTIMPAYTFTMPNDLRGRKRRAVVSQQLYDQLCELTFYSRHLPTHVFERLCEARLVHGARHPIMEDIAREIINYNQLLRGCFALGEQLSQYALTKHSVGLLLANSRAVIMCLFGLIAYQRVPAMLNYSLGSKALISAVTTARITTVVTSLQFIEKGKLQHLIDALLAHNINIVYLEDLKQRINLKYKIKALVQATFPVTAYRLLNRNHDPNDPAVILFTSGSEGAPKAVVLSHENILANCDQVSTRIDFTPQDVVFNALPVFHSFGLNCASFLPLFFGVKVFYYPSPLHYRVIPELVYDTDSTVLYGTDTFLKNYAKLAHPYDFYSLRYIYGSAEAVKADTQKLWMEKFGRIIFEGYGATELAPVASLNTPMHHKMGTVGRLLPAIKYRIEPVPGIETGGRLFLKGPNVMLGYYLPDNPSVLVQPGDGWYDTGDIVDMDEQGYITIKGRAKRFAKIAGEMVSLSAVEQAVNTLWPQALNAILTEPDQRKGERLILYTTHKDATRATLQAFFKQQGFSELWLPKTVEYIKDMPLLGSGKINYKEIYDARDNHSR